MSLHSWLKLVVVMHRVQLHLTFLLVIMGATLTMEPISISGSSLWTRLLLLYFSFNWALYGGIYIMNALADLPSDQTHKPYRPLPSGSLSRNVAQIWMACCFVLAAISAWWFGGAVASVFAAFLVLNLVYSYLWKAESLLRMAFISLTGPLRALLGAFIADATIPLHLVLAIYLGYFGIQVAKKRSELSNFDVPKALVPSLVLAFGLALFFGPGYEGLKTALVVSALLFWIAPTISSRARATLDAYFRTY